MVTNGFYTGHLDIHFLRSSDPIIESAFWVFVYEILLYLKETWHGASPLFSMNRCSSLACHHFQKYSPSGWVGSLTVRVARSWKSLFSWRPSGTYRTWETWSQRIPGRSGSLVGKVFRRRRSIFQFGRSEWHLVLLLSPRGGHAAGQMEPLCLSRLTPTGSLKSRTNYNLQVADQSHADSPRNTFLFFGFFFYITFNDYIA